MSVTPTRRLICALVFALSICVPRLAFPLPPILTVSDLDGEASVSLRVRQQAILGDAVSWCELRVQAAGDDVDWTAGDTISAWVYEDDLTNDDLVWTFSFALTTEELAAGFVDRTFDCSGAIDDDGGQPTSEVYGTALVDKDACGVFCTNDEPRTTNAVIQRVADDGFEEDDSSAQAVALLPGVSSGRIANDAADWISIDLVGASQIEAAVLHDPTVGALDATLLDASQTPIAVFQSQAEGSALSQSLPAGSYFVTIGPEDAGDPNFYDFELVVGPLPPTVPTLPIWLHGGLAVVLVASGMLGVRRGSARGRSTSAT